MTWFIRLQEVDELLDAVRRVIGSHTPSEGSSIGSHCLILLERLPGAVRPVVRPEAPVGNPVVTGSPGRVVGSFRFGKSSA